MVRMDREIRSSGGMVGKLMLEKDLAADRRARSDAVRLDLKAALSGLKGSLKMDMGGSSMGFSAMSCSSSSTPTDSGCSSLKMCGGERTGSRDFRAGLRVRCDRLK